MALGSDFDLKWGGDGGANDPYNKDAIRIQFRRLSHAFPRATSAFVDTIHTDAGFTLESGGILI